MNSPPSLATRGAAPARAPLPPAPRPVEIIGGGLAGLSLGLALRREGTPVVLHDAGDYPRHRVCGEFIAGLDEATRHLLGLDPFLTDALACQEVAWYRTGAPLLRQTLPSPAFAISRHTLDQRLVSAFVGAGGELRRGSRIDPLAAHAGRVHAHGRRPDHKSPWLGLKVHARGLALAADLEVHLGERAYVGLCAVDRERVNVCGLFHRRPGLASERGGALLAHLRAAGLEALAQRFEKAELDPDSHCAVAALSFGRVRAPAKLDHRLLLGDAHALIPPFTGNGMAMALQAAAIALPHLLRWSHAGVDWEETVERVREDLNRRHRLRLGAAALLHPVLLRRRAQAGLTVAARARLLPLTPLYHVLH